MNHMLIFTVIENTFIASILVFIELFLLPLIDRMKKERLEQEFTLQSQSPEYVFNT